MKENGNSPWRGDGRSHGLASRAFMVMGLIACLGCGHRSPAVSAAGVPPALLPSAPPSAGPAYRIQFGDELDVRFTYQPDQNAHVAVRPDGRISLPTTGEIEVVGRTPVELARQIEEASSAHLRDPEVTVMVTKLGEQRVYIGGEVARPGYVVLRPEMTLLQAVLQSGGFRKSAKLESVLLLTPGADGEFSAARVDMAQVVSEGVPERVRLHPDDIVFVPSTWIANMNDVVDAYVRGLIPVLPRVGVGYSLSQ